VRHLLAVQLRLRRGDSLFVNVGRRRIADGGTAGGGQNNKS
jgi:hypothetical protein